MVRKKSTVKKGGKLPKIVYAQASPKSIGGRSLFDAPLTTESDVEAYTSEDNILRNAVSELQNAGFEVLQVGDCTINIAGPPKLYEEVFKTKLVTDERPVIKEFGKEGEATFIDSTDIDSPGLISTSKGRVSNVIEGVAIEEPVYFFAANAFAPLKNYWHLRVPGDVSLGVNADKAHRGAMTGKGIKVVMTDTGWYRHPYFVQRGYRSSPVVLGPATASPNTDESGHGTGESANVFAVAPDVDFTMVKLSFVNSVGAFNAAAALSPHIISNSWGSSIRRGPLSARNQALAAAVASAVSRGIIVVFSAGNGHYGFPGQHPDVISAGGVYLEANGNMQASDYASGFASSIYPGRNVPDVSGLVGMRPKAAYIMLPLEPGDSIDRGNAGGTHPNGDETSSSDGWAAFSGTSAAAPQIAGACALIKQACGRLTPAQVRDILKSTARDVTVGTNNNGNTAGIGPDLATGHGLIDAYRAVMLAKLRCRPIGPIIAPTGPGVVVDPRGPITRKPITPRKPITRRPAPILPRPPLAEQCGVEEACDKESYISQDELTEEDRAELEQMIIRGEIEI
ncbi:MAG: S8 family serine peptidase [Gammaproteobacteria bacterium]|nr:S8 family serine peptidase [Gammaproteobacteria bacterium]